MKEKILITVKTYPVLSKTYAELVCTAGVNEDGNWRRIYPVPFRQLNDNQQYKKYQWIGVDLQKSPTDIRPETYRISGDLVNLNGPLPTIDKWRMRRESFVDKVPTHVDLLNLIELAHANQLSLALFRPHRWLGFNVEEIERDWDASKLAQLDEEKTRLNLFKDVQTVEEDFSIVNKLPYKFSYRFEDINGKKSKLMIEDWEIGALYWNCLNRCNGNEREAVKKVQHKYWNDFVRNEKLDTHLVLGTTLVHHNKKAPNPFVIVGVIPLPRDLRQRLF